jgi:hypothetical protein
MSSPPPGTDNTMSPGRRLILTKSGGKFALARPMAHGVEDRASEVGVVAETREAIFSPMVSKQSRLIVG